MKKYCIPVYFFLQGTLLLTSGISLGQITGIITDTSGKPLADVEVFINRTTCSSTSDIEGHFNLGNTPTGFHDIVLHKNGYALYRSSMRIHADRSYTLKLQLTKSKKSKGRLTLEEIKTLHSLIEGRNEKSIYIILNEKELKVIKKDGHRVLTSYQPLIIENNITGVTQKYYLHELPLLQLAEAPVKFELLAAPELQQTIDWEKKRKELFGGSQRHWLMTLVSGKLNEEKFSMYDKKGSVVAGNSITSSSTIENYVNVTINEPITVKYKNQKGTESSLVITDGAANVSEYGLPLNPKSVRVTGEMRRDNLIDQLPIEYKPITGNVEEAYSQTLEKFYEKIYVQTDKPYYYPGEAMWYKGYINYKEQAWRDSLSRVVYVELLNPKKEITLTKTLKIDSGLFNNDFILPDTLKAGTYYFRAYTNLNRNFGDSSLFVRPIPILTITDRVDHTQEKMQAEESSLLTITSDKKTYNTREKITLILQTKDKEGKPIAANLSISVTDATQVVPLTEPLTILTSFPFEKERPLKANELTYPVEYGIGFRGRFVNDNGKPEKTTLTILQMKPRTMMLTETDKQGFFSTAGFNFYNTAKFSIKADKAKDYPYGKVVILPREVANMDFEKSDYDLNIRSTQSTQRIISEYEVPKDVRLLQSVEVKARMTEKPVDRVKRPYGKADVVLSEKQLNDKGYGNLAYSLVGKVAGLIVMPESESIGFTRTIGQSIHYGSGPLVTINDVPMGGSAYDIISSINPSTVKSVEITKRINVLYGSQGANGVIAIYTKQGASEEDLKITPNFQRLEIAGYSSPRKFNEPDYESKIDKSQADYRSTLYWNPNVASDTQGKATVSFYAADLPSRYRIVVEGINSLGEPVRSIHFVDVED